MSEKNVFFCGGINVWNNINHQFEIYIEINQIYIHKIAEYYQIVEYQSTSKS